MLKRKLEEVDGEGEGPENATTSNGQSESDDSNCSAGSTDALAPEVASGPSPPKRMKKKVNFQGVTVYYFPRRQGFTCVPSEGGSTLGMSEKHTFHRDFSLSDYTKEQKRIHRSILAEQRRQGKMFPSPLLASNLPPQEHEDDISSGSESDSEYDDYYFLQPLPIRQRRVLLRTAGVKKIDNEEKDECRDIRVSRNVCGCDCKVFCDPATCACSQAGIQCQVDRLSFPCGCTKDGCSNPSGRIEFNPIRVRTHFIHTLMRLELERKDTECPENNSAAATTSFSPSSSTSSNGEIDVVGANGDEGVMSSESTDAPSDDNCSGASTDGSSGKSKNGTKVLKSRLKTKKTEAIDLNMFNSNERGSCRDCQNTDMCNVMMHDVKFSMVTHQQRQQQQQHQQQRVITSVLGPQSGYPGSQGPQLAQHHPLSLSPGISLLHPPPPPPPQQQQPQQSPQHMLLFNDGEEEVYQAENTTSMYFDNDDNSYSEMSETSSEVLESRPFASLSQASFSGKFHVSPSQMFTTSISTVNHNSSSNGSVHSHISSLSSQPSLLNPSCIQSLQVNGACGVSTSASCNTMGMEPHQQSCGMLGPPHQSSTAAAPSHSLLRPPFLPGILPPLPAQCGGPTAVMTPPRSLLSQNGPMSRTSVDTSLELDVSDNSLMLPGSAPSFQTKFSHTDILDTSSHPTGSSYKLDTPMLPSQGYGPSSSAVASTDYLTGSNHLSSFGPSAAVPSQGFGNPTTTVATNGNSTGFEPLPSPQLASCWSSSLASPTLRECFGLGTTSSLATASSADHPTPAGENGLAFPREAEPTAATTNPASPNSSTTTYATMTTTTRDRLAAHCPGISSHMDGRSEPSTTALKDTAPTFSTYHMSAESSETSSLVGSSQNLLYNLPYADSGMTASCPGVNLTSPATQLNLKSPSEDKDNLSAEKTACSALSNASITSSNQPSSFEIPDLYSAETSTVCLPSCSSSLASFTSSLMTSMASSTLGQTTDSTYTMVDPSTKPSESLKMSQSAVVSTGLTDNRAKEPVRVVPENSFGDGKEANSDEEPQEQSSKAEASNITSGNLEVRVVSAKKSSTINKELAMTEASSLWEKSKLDEEQETMDNSKCAKFSVLPNDGCDSERQLDTCVTDSETVSSGTSSVAQSAPSSSTSSSSSSPTTLEEEKEQNVSQNFGEIIKESIVEMVLV